MCGSIIPAIAGEGARPLNGCGSDFTPAGLNRARVKARASRQARRARAAYLPQGSGGWMRRIKRTEVFVETEVEIEVRRRTLRLAPVWCAACGAEVEMVPPDVAAAIAEVSARTVFGWVEAGLVHFAETPEGALLVCLRSLSCAPAGAHVMPQQTS